MVLKNLQSNFNIVTLCANKDNATVALNSDEYISEMNLLFQDGSYIPVNQHPTSKIEREIRNLFLRGSNPPRLFDLPKIDKQNIPLKLIVNL